MNRLIIVGNGFDLAHGLKTSYCDFLNAYLKNALDIFYEKKSYDDPLLKLSHYAASNRYTYPYTSPVEIQDVYKHLKELKSNQFWKVTFKSRLLEQSLEKSNNIRWVDLENDFFEELTYCLDNRARTIDSVALNNLNNQFGFLKHKLEEYLLTVQFDEEKFKPDPEIGKIFKEKIDPNDVVFRKVSSTALQKTMFLNFNYTNTLSKYVDKTKTTTRNPLTGVSRITEDVINPIHGVLGSMENKIVFGFGDEYDEEYLKFENLKNNNLFNHIKSFSYLKTRNYHDLVRFLNEREFQVFIMGHSCGLSDRTMFRKIFEHGNCLSVKIFYYKRPDDSTDFTEKTYDLARHFTNKGEMREKIVAEPNSSSLPQYNM